jgi:hypothetical protein
LVIVFKHRMALLKRLGYGLLRLGSRQFRAKSDLFVMKLSSSLNLKLHYQLSIIAGLAGTLAALAAVAAVHIPIPME